MTKQHKEQSKAIKSLTQNADKGSMEAQFQLYEYYDKGKYVIKDEALAHKYFQMYESSLIGKSIRLKSLKLWEFRRFRSLDISFDDNITVITGDNGAGKTAIAEAASKIFSWFNNNLEKDYVSGKPINPDDININATDYAEITSIFNLGKNNKFEASLARAIPGFAGSQSSGVNVIKKLAEMYRKAAKNKEIMIPLLTFYSVDRSCLTLKKPILEKASGNTTNNRFSALKDASDSGGKLDNFSELYIELVNLSEGQDTKEIRDLRSQISILEQSIHDVYENEQPPEGDRFSAKLNEKKEELSVILNSLPSAKYQRHLDFVNKAIETLVPAVKNLRIDRSSGKVRIMVENFGNVVNITQLSQGQKMFVALAGDLARRLVTLNPESDKPLNCHGIVIIDEVDLHLHPKWQQKILIGLQSTFPNLQFIVTTHSPQVLSTVRRENIRTLELDASGQVAAGQPFARTYGEPSGDVLHSVMLVDPLPPIAEKADLQRLTEFVDQGLYDELEATQLTRKLIAVLGEQHPQLLRLQRSIQRQRALKG